MKMLTQIEVVDIENLKHIPKIKFCGYTECFKDANEKGVK